MIALGPLLGRTHGHTPTAALNKQRRHQHRKPLYQPVSQRGV